MASVVTVNRIGRWGRERAPVGRTCRFDSITLSAMAVFFRGLVGQHAVEAELGPGARRRGTGYKRSHCYDHRTP